MFKTYPKQKQEYDTARTKRTSDGGSFTPTGSDGKSKTSPGTAPKRGKGSRKNPGQCVSDSETRKESMYATNPTLGSGPDDFERRLNNNYSVEPLDDQDKQGRFGLSADKRVDPLAVRRRGYP